MKTIRKGETVRKLYEGMLWAAQFEGPWLTKAGLDADDRLSLRKYSGSTLSLAKGSTIPTLESRDSYVKRCEAMGYNNSAGVTAYQYKYAIDCNKNS